MNQGSDIFGREQLEKRHEENSVFTRFLLIFYCYLLILVNELSANLLKINNLKNKKNENAERTAQFAGNGVFGDLSIGNNKKAGF